MGLGVTGILATSQAMSVTVEPRTYAELLREFRRQCAAYSREDMPALLADRPPRPSASSTNHVLNAWKAKGDALLDRALALGYVIGIVTGVQQKGETSPSEETCWIAIAQANVYGRIQIHHVVGTGPQPPLDSCVLVTRGYHRGAMNTEQPHLPVSSRYLT